MGAISQASLEISTKLPTSGSLVFLDEELVDGDDAERLKDGLIPPRPLELLLPLLLLPL